MLFGCKNFQKDYKIDYVKLRDELTRDYDRIRVYFYSGVDPTNESQIGFHKALRESGFHVEGDWDSCGLYIIGAAGLCRYNRWGAVQRMGYRWAVRVEKDYQARRRSMVMYELS